MEETGCDKTLETDSYRWRKTRCIFSAARKNYIEINPLKNRLKVRTPVVFGAPQQTSKPHRVVVDKSPNMRFNPENLLEGPS